MKRIFVSGVLFLFLFVISINSVFAASNFFFVLPRTSLTEDECVEQIEIFEQAWYSSGGKSVAEVAGRDGGLNSLLGCAIKTGDIHLAYVPFYVKGIIEFLLAIAGLLSVVFIIVGGYKVMVGGLIEDKESGKKTITHAIAGLIVCFLSWGIVNIVQMLLTG